MKLSKAAKQLAEDLELTKAEAAVMELKSKLYEQCAMAITSSRLTHEEIAKLVGTSRARVSRLSKMAEASVSLELLIKIVATLENRMPVKVA